MNSSTVLISRQKLYDIIKRSGCETIDEKFNLIKIEIEKRVKNCDQNDLKKNCLISSLNINLVGKRHIEWKNDLL